MSFCGQIVSTCQLYKPLAEKHKCHTVTWRGALDVILARCQKHCTLWTAISAHACQTANFSWKATDDLTEENLTSLNFNENTESGDQDGPALQYMADHLHEAADSLPAYERQKFHVLEGYIELLSDNALNDSLLGCLVDVYLWPPKDTETRDYTLLLGALRRFKDWHNASVTIFDRDLTPQTEFLQKFLSATICCLDDVERQNENEGILWRGKVSICDKIENKGVTVPGITLTKLKTDTPDLVFPLPHPQHSESDKISHPCLLGRMIEVLDEVRLSTIPAIFMTNCTYRLCLYQKHPYAQVLMNYIQQGVQTGLLARLAVYPESKKLPMCKDTNLSTNTWKDNIMADIQFVQEPEEDYQDNYEFLYFIITSPDNSLQNSTDEVSSSFTAYAHLLKSPYQLSRGDIVGTICEQMLVRPRGGGGEVEIDKLPVMTWEGLREINVNLMQVQNTYLQNLLDSRKKANLSTVLSVTELNSCLIEIRKNFLAKLSEVLPVAGESHDTLEVQLQKIMSEVSLNPQDWAERQIQQYCESQRRSLSRIRSTESMPMSSPIQHCDATRTVDIQDFLKYFNPDGSAAADNLSPVRRPASSRTHSRKTHLVGDLNRTGWPENSNSETHDVYYNTSKKCERMNDHMNKLRDRWVKDDTSSSCISGPVLFPKPSKQRQSGIGTQELRRSPRKKSNRMMLDENLSHSQKSGNVKSKVSRLSDTSTPLATIQPAESRRRFSTPHPSAAHSISFSQPSFSHQHPASRRRSEISHSQTGTPLPRQIKKLRRESDTGPISLSQPVKTESRSERHKRKLQEIVDQVLIDNGVTRDDPIFPSCSIRLFKVTKLFVMDLPTSRNLKQEMKKIAESQVKQVIEVDRARRKSQDFKK